MNFRKPITQTVIGYSWMIGFVFLSLSVNLYSQSMIDIPVKAAELNSVTFPVPLDSSNFEFEDVSGSLYTLKASLLNPRLKECRDLSIFFFNSNNKSYVSQIHIDSNRFIWKNEFKRHSIYNFKIWNCASPSDTLFIPFKIQPSENSLRFKISRGYKGEFSLADSSYTGTVSILPFVRFLNQIHVIINHQEEVVFREELSWGESFSFRDKIFTLDTLNLFEKSIQLEYRINEGEKVFGVGKNQYIDDFDKRRTRLFDETIHLSKEAPAQDGDYIFHFWGSWCAPCMRKMPYLQELFSRLDNHRINVINVALVNSLSNLIQTEGVIEDQSLLGTHVLEKLNGDLGFIHLLNISSYPSYVVVSNDGKVIYRSDEMGEKHDLEDFLKMNNYLKD